MTSRTRTLLATALVAFVALPLAACGSDSDSSSGDGSGSADQEVSAVTVTKSGPVKLGVGERATIELEANPSTGYQWEPTTEPDAAVVRVVSDTYTAGPSDRVGAAGTQKIVVEGVAAGNTTLELGYVRPWETDTAPAETATFEITVS
jgi:inhibitor of cysteine peptidase